jgi:hypothetical protein
MHNRTNLIFSQGIITEVLALIKNNINSEIEYLSEDYVLNVNTEEYALHISDTFEINTPAILFDQAYADSYEADIPYERFGRSHDVEPGKTYKKEIIQYFIPVDGSIKYLRYSPESSFTFGGGGGSFSIASNTIVVELINFQNDPKIIKQEIDREVNGVKPNYNTLLKDINSFNDSIKSYVITEIEKRKKKILNSKNLLSQLGVPLRKRDNTAQTFTTPNPAKRKKIHVKPKVSEKGFTPEPTLDFNEYTEILKLINDVGKNFERLPSTYKDKGEEDLRDHILMILDPNFELGSATGETFNKTGKSDILLKYDSSIIFIAECKFWSGQKNYLGTISQLLNYMTWRETKASVIVFVNQQDFSSVLNKVEQQTKEHPNYLGYVNNSDENWFNYRFHLNGDTNREIKLAVQLFHLPKK